VLWSATLLPVVSASGFPNLFSKVSSSSLLQFIFKISVTIVREPYFFYYKFVVSALSSLLNGMLHYQHMVIALKIIIHNNIVCFYLQTSKIKN